MKTEDKNRPSFPLMTLSHIVSFYHMQMPRWLFCDQRYADMTLETKVAYAFLLNRFQLSRRNGWVNEHGEVYVIFTREELAREMQISYRKAIACFKELCEKRLVWETRSGRGMPNRIFMAEVALDASAVYRYDCAPFCAEQERPAEMTGLQPDEPEDEEIEKRPEPANGGLPDVPEMAESLTTDAARPANMAVQEAEELQKTQFCTCGNGSSKTAEPASQDLPKSHPSNNNTSKTEKNDTERNHPSINGPLTDSQKLALIENACELSRYSTEEAHVFREATALLFYSTELRIGKCCYPQDYVRSRLVLLTPDVLDCALSKIKANENPNVRNPVAYIAKIIFGSIAEVEGELLLDPVVNHWKEGHTECRFSVQNSSG